MQNVQSRRDFLPSASLAVTAGVLGAPASLANEGPPEIATIPLGYWPRYTCLAPQSISEALLRAEGFTDVRFVPPTEINSVAGGTIDFDLDSAAWLVSQLDAGAPLTVLAGVHLGCFELFAYEPIRTISDLKGKRVGIEYLGSAPHMYLSIMAAQVGLRPDRDIEWVANPIAAVATAETGSMQRFLDRRGRCLPRLSARAAGTARPQDRPRDPEHEHGCAMVAVLLLHVAGTRQFVRDIRSPPSACCGRSSRPPTSV